MSSHNGNSSCSALSAHTTTSAVPPPQDLKALLGRSEISLSLHTDKKLIARERAADLYTRTGGFFHKARTLDEQASPSLFQRAGSDTKTV
ncbi:DUF6538 domain-containing protein, partial [Acetobacter indonesiensis]|uniref:DUF6538 domain-containing protein n=1 Tax=Acetobacter indonesiensis TaxID=104101 RepID=UPI0035716FDC